MDQMLLAKIAYGCRMIVSFWPIVLVEVSTRKAVIGAGGERKGCTKRAMWLLLPLWQRRLHLSTPFIRTRQPAAAVL